MFPDIKSISNVLQPKSDKMKYVRMVDMSAPIPMERISPCDGTSVDGIRVIFKKEKIDLAYEYCEHIQKQGYFVCVNFVGTDLYTDKEFIDGIEKFNQLHPYAVSIVDSFGLIKRKQFCGSSTLRKTIWRKVSYLRTMRTTTFSRHTAMWKLLWK